MHTLYCGDNLEWLQDIPNNSVDLCYIDPPFYSKKTYEVIWGDGKERASFDDKFRGGVKHYITWMKPRIELIHSKLKDTGSILLHCDKHANHRLRVLLDDIFGEHNFINEIIWQRSSPQKGSHHKPRSFGHCTDTILFYSKSSNKHFFEPIYIPRTEEQMKKKYGNKNYCYDRIVLSKFNSSLGGSLDYEYNGYRPENGWQKNRQKLEALDKEGRIYWPEDSTKDPKIIYYSDEDIGLKLSNLWLDIPIASKKERIGYPTQKPISLIERLLKACSKEGDIVLDCFLGGGTTLEACMKLGRSFIGGDISPVAIKIAVARTRGRFSQQVKLVGIGKTKEQYQQMPSENFRQELCHVMGWHCVEDDLWDSNGNPILAYNGVVDYSLVQQLVNTIQKQDRKMGFVAGWDITEEAKECVTNSKQVDISFLDCHTLLSELIT